MILTSLKSQEEYTFNKVGFPQALVFDHFENVLFESPFFAWMGNSIILAAGAVLLSTVGLLPRRLCHRPDASSRAGALLFSVSTALMAVPPVVMIVPLFVLYTQLDLISTYQGAIVIYAGLITPFSVYLLTTFFRTLPQELFESARMDGAGDFFILWRSCCRCHSRPADPGGGQRALCLERPVIAIIFLQDDFKRTLMAGISVFQGRYEDQIP